MKTSVENIQQAIGQCFNLEPDKLHTHVIAYDFYALFTAMYSDLKPYECQKLLGVNSNSLCKFKARAIKRIENDGMLPVAEKIRSILTN